MESKLRLSCVMGCLLLATSTLAIVGCGDDSKSDGSAASSGGASGSEGGEQGSPIAGADSDSGSSEGGTGSDKGDGDGDGPDPGGTSSGARPNVEPGGPDLPDPGGAGGADGGDDSLDFDGVDLSDVSADAPSGCVGGFDRDAGTLTIEVGDQAPVVRLSVHEGVVQANGVDCESESGDPAKAEEVLSLAVTAGSGDQAVYLDLSDGAFSGCTSESGGISIALGAGSDRVTVLGTNEADVFHLGDDAGKVVLDLSGDDRVDLTIDESPAIVISTGAKGDEVRADGAALGLSPVSLALALYGGGSRDVLVGGAAADRLFGGIGNDWFDAGAAPAGGDVFDGGDGSDTIDFSARSKPLTISMGQGADDGEADEGADVSDSVENLYGGQSANTITGGSAANFIWGGPEADVLDGGDGSDLLAGGDGDDTLRGGLGDDMLYGEAGDDELDGGSGDDLLSDTEGENVWNAGAGDGDICIPTQLEKAAGCEL